ncbi:hypothetical protein H3S80_08445 [Bartonella sp. M0177]|uniref:hypothetical protein n=1 Tax=Bartonella sp. M0177 TaxID=2750940 RepID=UPI0018DD2ED1|nr:hypothetical protein [Bartonella sp. M0177]MBI0004075.1 hypothetical protein [Bartonella sp. M0177]
MTFIGATGILFFKRIFLDGGKFILQTKFYDFVAICYADAKTILLARSIFSKDYSLKEQTWLAIYERGYPRKAEVQPAAFNPTCNAISKRQALPCLFIITKLIIFEACYKLLLIYS